ncbi:MAG TPA: tetratricopeptide repeat protein, partial [Armatimonadetes bacterium]|nr:tetratricopeptide repeat protein [Armatimonadota bacterium]
MNKWSFWWIGGLCLAMGLLCWALLRAWRGQRTVPFAAFESLNTYQRARALQAQGDLTGAVRVWQEVLERNPQQEDALYALGQLFWKQGRYEEAVQTLQQLVKVNPASARGHLLLGRVYSTPWPGAPVDLSWAWEEVERCAELNPQDSEPFLYLGRIFFAKDEPQRALEYLSRVPLAAPRGPEAAYLAGIIHLRQGEADVAQQAFQRAWEQGERERPVPQPLPADDPAAARPLSPQDRVRLKALFGLAEIARQVGGYPEEVPAAYRWHWPPEESRSPVRFRPANDRLNPRPQEVGRAAWGDYDGDGDPDLAVASLHGLLRLYRNEGARFTDVAREIGLHDIFGSWDVVWADVEGDGTLDLYVVRSGWVGRSENALYLQRGGRFREVTRAVGLGGLRATSRVAFFDADGDGDLDLLEVGAAVQDAPPVRLYLREGSRFVDRAAERGLSSAGHVVDAAVGDYNGDGREDVFLLGWRQPGRLYRNEGGKFADVTALAG